MTRTSNEAALGFKTIPPSTFVNDLADLANVESQEVKFTIKKSKGC